MKVAVLGAAGGIGQALALLLKNRLPAGSELSLYDIALVTLVWPLTSVIFLPTSPSRASAVKIRLLHWLGPMWC